MSNESANNKSSRVSRQLQRHQRPLLSLPQLLVLAAIVFAVYVGFDLNRRAQVGAQIEYTEAILESKLQLETTRQVELIMTRDYVDSDAYVAAYARNEAGLVQPGERRVVPLLINATPVATPIPTATPDPAYDARPWQAWWRLLSDAPLPSR